jgi:hypothetical protein
MTVGRPIWSFFFGDEIPSYVILSHIWGPKGSEVIYEDIVKGTAAERKARYAKIRFCGEKAASHGTLAAVESHHRRQCPTKNAVSAIEKQLESSPSFTYQT